VVSDRARELARIRSRRYRARQKRGAVVVAGESPQVIVERLIDHGWLEDAAASDPRKVCDALVALASCALSLADEDRRDAVTLLGVGLGHTSSTDQTLRGRHGHDNQIESLHRGRAEGAAGVGREIRESAPQGRNAGRRKSASDG
jgi:hypothetical protein